MLKEKICLTNLPSKQQLKENSLYFLELFKKMKSRPTLLKLKSMKNLKPHQVKLFLHQGAYKISTLKEDLTCLINLHFSIISLTLNLSRLKKLMSFKNSSKLR